jgi:hypothetical protein
MRDRRASLTTDMALRAGGALLLVGAWAVGSALLASGPELAASGPRALHFALATAAFLGATSGVACLALGRHLFDRVTVARPWGGGDIAYLRHYE